MSRLLVGRSLVQKRRRFAWRRVAGTELQLRPESNDARKPKYDRSFNYQNSGNPAKDVCRVGKDADTAKKCVGQRFFMYLLGPGGRGRERGEGGLELNRSYGGGGLGDGGGGGVGGRCVGCRSGRE